MTTIDEIRAEIEQHKNDKFNCIGVNDVLKIIDKYAEQEQEQLRKAQKNAKRWKRKFCALMRVYDDTATDRSKECNYCRHFNDPTEKICKKCYHYYTDKFQPNTKGGVE